MTTGQRLTHWLHRLFEASLLFKGLLASIESLCGLALWLTPNASLLWVLDWMTRNRVTQDADDPMARWFHDIAMNLPIQTQHFYAMYLLAHGGLKLGMVILLAFKVRWAYPAAMVVLTGFVVYQMSQFFHDHSPVLLGLSLFDCLMIVLVWREWRLLPEDGVAA